MSQKLKNFNVNGVQFNIPFKLLKKYPESTLFDESIKEENLNISIFLDQDPLEIPKIISAMYNKDFSQLSLKTIKNFNLDSYCQNIEFKKENTKKLNPQRYFLNYSLDCSMRDIFNNIDSYLIYLNEICKKIKDKNIYILNNLEYDENRSICCDFNNHNSYKIFNNYEIVERGSGWIVLNYDGLKKYYPSITKNYINKIFSKKNYKNSFFKCRNDKYNEEDYKYLFNRNFYVNSFLLNSRYYQKKSLSYVLYRKLILDSMVETDFKY